MKKETETNEEKVGVVVARFQISELTNGHKDLLDFVLSKNHSTNIIVLGLSKTIATKHNPLPFVARKSMIEQMYPGKFVILYINDTPDDESWSRKIDELIEPIRANRNVIMYGSRDSFIAHYHGRWECEEYQQRHFISATEVRNRIGKCPMNSVDFRNGVIWATQNRYPTSYQTVDIALFNRSDHNGIYMGRKSNSSKWRFIGGFVDPTDESLEAAANRELGEEAGLIANEERVLEGYVCSGRVSDWRYAAEEDKICTAMFAFHTTGWGSVKAGDDMNEIQLFSIADFKKLDIVPEHVFLRDNLLKWMDTHKGTVDIETAVAQQLD